MVDFYFQLWLTIFPVFFYYFKHCPYKRILVWVYFRGNYKISVYFGMIILNLQTKAHVSGIHVEFFEWFTSPHILEAKQRRKIYTKKLIWSQKLDTFIWWAFNSSGGDSKTPSISVVKRKKLSLEMWSVLFFGTAILKASIWVGGQGEIMYLCIPVWLMNSSHICYFIALHNTSLGIQRQGAPLPRGESDAGGCEIPCTSPHRWGFQSKDTHYS